MSSIKEVHEIDKQKLPHLHHPVDDLLVGIIQIAIGIGQHQCPERLARALCLSSSERGIKVNGRRLLRESRFDDISIINRVAEILSLSCFKLNVQWDQWHEVGMSPKEMIKDSKVFGQIQDLMRPCGMQPFAFHLLQVNLH